MCVERALLLVLGIAFASSGVVRFSRLLCSIYNDYVNLNVFARVQCKDFVDRQVGRRTHITQKQLMVRCRGSWCEISVNYLMGFSAAGVHRSSFDTHFTIIVIIIIIIASVVRGCGSHRWTCILPFTVLIICRWCWVCAFFCFSSRLLFCFVHIALDAGADAADFTTTASCCTHNCELYTFKSYWERYQLHGRHCIKFATLPCVRLLFVNNNNIVRFS